MSDVKMVVSFMLVMSLAFTLCYIANQWWLFIVIMALYLIRQGINQYSNSKAEKVQMEISSTWKFMIALIFLIQISQIIFIGIIIYSLPPDFINVALNTYERLDSNNMLDKSIRVTNALDASLPYLSENITGGDIN